MDSMSAPGTQMVGKGVAPCDLVAKIIKPEAGGSMTAVINMTFFGAPRDVQKFLREIENMDVLTMVRNVVFIKEAGGTKSINRLKVSIPLQFYFLPIQNET